MIIFVVTMVYVTVRNEITFELDEKDTSISNIVINFFRAHPPVKGSLVREFLVQDR